jgi:peptidyl-prolyl cis-trans isomerase B (cyclophilin B)
MIGSTRKNTGASPLTPFLVMLGAVIIIVIAFILSNYLFVTEGQRKDNGIYLDSKKVERGQPYAYIDVEGFGTIKVELNEEKAPITVNNFMDLSNDGFYDGLTFHRVILNFMIQGGDPNGDGTGGPGYTIQSEADNGLTNDRGAIAMAKRGNDVRMSGSQFYIVQAKDGAHNLDGQHTVFGKVVDGMDVVDKIASVPTDSNDKPLTPVIIKHITIKFE